MGKRVQWFTADEVNIIKQGKFNYKAIMKDMAEETPFEGKEFEKPSGWDEAMEEAKMVVGVPS